MCVGGDCVNKLTFFNYLCTRSLSLLLSLSLFSDLYYIGIVHIANTANVMSSKQHRRNWKKRKRCLLLEYIRRWWNRAFGPSILYYEKLCRDGIKNIVLAWQFIFNKRASLVGDFTLVGMRRCVIFYGVWWSPEGAFGTYKKPFRAKRKVLLWCKAPSRFVNINRLIGMVAAQHSRLAGYKCYQRISQPTSFRPSSTLTWRFHLLLNQQKNVIRSEREIMFTALGCNKALFAIESLDTRVNYVICTFRTRVERAKLLKCAIYHEKRSEMESLCIIITTVRGTLIY